MDNVYAPLAKQFYGRIETAAYGAGKLKAGGLNVRNDGALSDMELRKALSSGKLNKNDLALAKQLRADFAKLDYGGKTSIGGGPHNFFTIFIPDSKLSNDELVYSLNLSAEKKLWGNILSAEDQNDIKKYSP